VGAFLRGALSAGSDVGEAALAYLFAADRRDHLDRTVLPALRRGTAVVTDRYYHSSLAYQSLALGLPAVAGLNTGFQPPDLTLFLDLEPERCRERIRARGAAPERFEALDRLRAVRDAYDQVFAWCFARGERIARIDASGPVEAVHARVVAEVSRE
jgi:dTMP kinase